MSKRQSRIEKLIAELCPEGVEFVPLWTVTTWDKRFNAVDRAKQPQIISYPYLLAADLFSLEQDDGDVFLLSTGEQTGWTTEELAGENLREGEVVTIPWGKSRPVKEVLKYYKGRFVTADNRIATSIDTNKLSNKFLYYWMISQGEVIDTFYRGSGIKHPSMAAVLDMSIPIPPLAIQQEIVKILDTFTTLETELETELEAELEARKKQYEYYRDELLTFGEDACLPDRQVEWKTLGEVAEIGTGSSNTNEEIEDGLYPFFVRSPIVRFKNTFEFDETAIITSGDGVGVGKIFHFIEGKYALHQRAYRIHIIDRQLNPKFFFFYMRNTFEKYILGSAVNSSVTSVRRPMLNKYPVPLPPLSEQERIVAILDKFDALVNDISVGLPAELNARRKQYEYYRNKLLTFEPLEKEYA
jgi:type I restriction enzyme, S subunit